MRDSLGAHATPYFHLIQRTHFPTLDFTPWVDGLIADLIRSGAAVRGREMIGNAG